MSNASTQPVNDKSAVILLAGFLGAGKTTLLKRILGWETSLSGTVVLVNEFGSVGIDGDLLKASGTDVVELTSGCICCTLSADLKQSLTNIWEQYKPHRIFIEASGVADPTTILNLLEEPHLGGRMHLQKVVTVLDADFWEARENFGPLFYNQLAAANLILLNKVDQVEPTKIPSYLKEIHYSIPGCQVIPTVHCAIDPSTLFKPAVPESGMLKPMHRFRPLSIEQFDAIGKSSNGGQHGERSHVSAEHFVTFSFTDNQIMDRQRFHQFVQMLPLEVFRMKGYVRFSDRTDFINYVGGKGEWSAWDGHRQTRLAFIGWNVNATDILEPLKRCIIQQHL